MKSLLLLLILPVVLCSMEKEVCKVNSRILGGEYAEEGEFPGIVYLSGRAWDSSKLKETGYECAGSLINDRSVLTAAHCVFLPQPLHFRSVRVHPAKTHPYFIESREVLPFSKDPFYVEDIGLIWLPQPMSSIHPNFKPVALPMQGQELTSSEVTLVGWGVTSTTEEESPLHLMKREHVQLNQTLCRRGGYSATKALCRYPTRSTGNSCPGDSGGPIFMDGLQVGIVSADLPKENFGFISKDTRVSAYREWIDARTKSRDMIRS